LKNNPRQRNIIILGSAYPLRGGGIATYNERLARAYQQHGDNVTIITFSLQYPSFLFPGTTQYSTEAPPDDLHIEVLVNSVNPLNWIKVGRLIKKRRPDLLVLRYWIPFMGPCLGTISRIARRNRHTRIVAIVDNYIPHERRPGDKLFSKYFIKPIHGFVTMSRQVLSDLAKADNKKPRQYCPHPLYDNFGALQPKATARERLGQPVDGRYLLFFGFIRDYKGLDLLLEAMALPEVVNTGAHLIVAGEFYADAKLYHDIIERHQLQQRVILATEFIPNDAVADYFNAADLVVQPYKEATQSGVTQVAYHFEKPMVTTNVGGLSEMVPDGVTGFVVEPEVKAIAQAVARFYDENREAEFVENIKKEKLKFSWERMLEAIDEVAAAEAGNS
jgi:glycosyltransferase involved in cell wall biosynthesis